MIPTLYKFEAALSSVFMPSIIQTTSSSRDNITHSSPLILVLPPTRFCYQFSFEAISSPLRALACACSKQSTVLPLIIAWDQTQLLCQHGVLYDMLQVLLL